MFEYNVNWFCCRLRCRHLGKGMGNHAAHTRRAFVDHLPNADNTKGDLITERQQPSSSLGTNRSSHVASIPSSPSSPTRVEQPLRSVDGFQQLIPSDAVKDFNSRLEVLTAKLMSAESDKQNLRAELSSARTALRNTSNDLMSERTIAATTVDALARAEERINSLQTDLLEKNELNRNLSTELQHVRISLERTANEHEEISQRARESELTLSAMLKEKNELMEGFANAAALKAELREKQEHILFVDDQMIELRRQIAELSEENSRLMSSVQRLETANEADTKRGVQSLYDCNAENAILRLELQNLRHSVAVLRNEQNLNAEQLKAKDVPSITQTRPTDSSEHVTFLEGSYSSSDSDADVHLTRSRQQFSVPPVLRRQSGPAHKTGQTDLSSADSMNKLLNEIMTAVRKFGDSGSGSRRISGRRLDSYEPLGPLPRTVHEALSSPQSLAAFIEAIQVFVDFVRLSVSLLTRFSVLLPL